MKLNLKNIVIELAIIGMVALPLLVSGQIVPGEQAPITTLGEAKSTITVIVRWIIAVFWIITVLFLIIAAFRYLTAAGDPEKIGKAKQALIFAIIAAAIALLANGIQLIVKNLLQGTATGV